MAYDFAVPLPNEVLPKAILPQRRTLHPVSGTTTAQRTMSMFDSSKQLRSREIVQYLLPSKIEISSLPHKEIVVEHSFVGSLLCEDDTYVAIIDELDIYGTGGDRYSAIRDLKIEIVDLAIFLFSTEDSELGAEPLLWKESLKYHIRYEEN